MYGNTWLQGSSFEYLGDPIKILKGRLIVVGDLVIFFLAAYLLPIIEKYSWIPFFLILPWLVVTARTFNARNSSYRNIQFDFRATWRDAFKVFFGLPTLAFVTAGLATWGAVKTGETWVAAATLVVPLGYPYFACRRSEIVVSHNRYGTTPFVLSWQDTITTLGIDVRSSQLRSTNLPAGGLKRGWRSPRPGSVCL